MGRSRGPRRSGSPSSPVAGARSRDAGRIRLSALLAGALVAAAAAPTAAATARDQLCSAGAREPARDPRIHEAVRLARQQHALFGGQWIDRRGRLAAVGYHEAEFDRLPSETVPTWERVAGFWHSLGPELPPSFRSPDGSTVRLAPLREWLGRREAPSPGGSFDEPQRRAIDSALLRTALVDQPWSAVFISFLLKSSGFTAAEFAFSDTHADYVDQAVLATAAETKGESTAAAYRACDLASTPPRAGDLVCHTREGAAAVRRLGPLAERLALRRVQPAGNGLPMHCDLVTRADAGGDAKLEAIGGNVVQSVTLRQLALDAGKRLSRTHFDPGQGPGCERAPCPQDLNRKPWVVLLQFRL